MRLFVGRWLKQCLAYHSVRSQACKTISRPAVNQMINSFMQFNKSEHDESCHKGILCCFFFFFLSTRWINANDVLSKTLKVLLRRLSLSDSALESQTIWRFLDLIERTERRAEILWIAKLWWFDGKINKYQQTSSHSHYKSWQNRRNHLKSPTCAVRIWINTSFLLTTLIFWAF